MQIEIKNYNSYQNRVISQYANKIQRAIYDFSSSTNDTFIFPKSFKYKVIVKDSNSKTLYKINDEKNFKKSIRLDINLAENRLNAKNLTLIKEISYKRIYLKILILVICISLFIFISIFLIIKASIEPYKKVNEYLDAFFNDAMHELKTPLGIIQLNLEILQEKQAKTKEIERSINATKNLLLVYEDIEYLIKQKSVSYNKEQIEFSYLLWQRIDQFESLTVAKNLNFDTQIEPNIQINLNRIHLQRIIDNTISNAIKYSNKNTTITIKLYKKEENLIFSVHNIGKTIKDKKAIFNRYYKENSIKGIGLGLNIVKNICDENQIKIEVQSEKHSGTKFKYTFLTST
ncbi:MAG: sensor histidine kinase [Halarcobacter sp.]